MAVSIASSVSHAMLRIGEVLNERRREGHDPILYIPGNAGRIQSLESWLFDNAHMLTDRGAVRVFQTLALGPASGWASAVAQGVVPVTPFIGAGMRDLVNRGLARNIRSNLSQVHTLFRGRWQPDVAVAHVSPPDDLGRVTLGLNAGLDSAPVFHAAYKVAVVNTQMPRWHIGVYFDPETNRFYESGCAMRLNAFDLVLWVDEPLFEHTMVPKRTDQMAAERIAETIIRVLRSKKETNRIPYTIQLGIGTIPNALARALAERKIPVRGVWSEMFSDGVLRLYRDELIEQKRGPHLRDRIVVGFVLGTRELYETMRENPDFAVLPQEIVNDPEMIKRNHRMASINATLAVSLHGEVAAATIGTRHHSDVGGQYDFAQGASCSRDGMAIIALPSTAVLKDGSRESRIVATHDAGAHHTISADLPVLVVTEYGCADLRGLDDTERVEAMLNIAHPDWRDLLAKEARQLPALQGVGVVPARLVGLRSGATAIARPATAQDIPAIKTYITSLSDKDRRTRYMGAVSPAVLTADERMYRLYDHTLNFEEHAAFVLESGGAIIGVAHAFREDDGSYEVSFSRRSDQEGEGIGVHLMCMLIDWARATEVTTLRAITYRTGNPRMRALFRRFHFTVTDDPDEPQNVRYTACVRDLVVTRARVSIA